ncbi:AAA family ATPase [Lacibacter sediminis]|uniref:AAA family ATPase n=1 Tax=Lacibacter sediminis TaxID=2760713 RepID=A0A7G5XKX3_9BACT|nr:AAA family ATPase [Lacibacter sediminis]QNA46126.1 AAA family ATPase [Lacibacter sediminis]
MKIKKINHIKEYKSFLDFKWSEFCLDSAGGEKSFCPYNVVFGENGSGKSSICEILKDISQHTPFNSSCDKPNSIQIKIDSNLHNYTSNAWDNSLPKNSILFFDQTFIDENVHTNGERSNEKNRHSQNAGKLLIDLDAEANRKKQEEKDTAKALKDFEDENTIKLNYQFLPADLQIYTTLKDKSEKELIDLKDANNAKHKSTSDDIEQLKLRRNQTANVSSFNPPEDILLTKELLPISEFQEIFTRKIEDSSAKLASENLIKHISDHKAFIETGLQIKENSENKDSCPFCLQSLKSQEEIIKSYSAYFNQTYKEQKAKYIEDIESIKDNLNDLKKEAIQLPIKIANSYKILSEFWSNYNVGKFSAENSHEGGTTEGFIELYSLEEKLNHVLNYPKAIDDLLIALENLKTIDIKTYDFNKDYYAVFSHLSEVKIALVAIMQSLKKYTGRIIEFKAKYSEVATINQEIVQKEPELLKLTDLKNYFDKNYHSLIKEWYRLKDEKETLRVASFAAKDDLKAYILTQAPTLILSKMMSFLNRFNLSFTLEPNRVAGSTSEVPFSFKILDLKGSERNIKTGLSEGERQLISLAFFFAINENAADKRNKILVFDDPITSLDASNLKILSDVIFEHVNVYSQVFVFTHHPLFYKYLIKKENPNPNKFGILKNTIAFKGSLIYVDTEFDLLAQLKGSHQSLIAKASLGTLSLEEAAVTYGHLLRLSVERFIKNELLMWNKEDSFSTITGGLKDAKSKIKLLADADLDTIEKVFKYCNYANFLHADKEASSALNELLQHIEKYLVVVDAVRNPVPSVATTPP